MRTRLRLYGAVTTLGWRLVRHRVAVDEGRRKVAAGEWAEVYDEFGNHVGYQVTAMREERGDFEIAPRTLPVSVTRGQMEIMAGQSFPKGQSKTIGLSEAKRLERAERKHPFTGKPLEAEDTIERVTRKVQAFPFIGASRGDILRVWPLDAAAPLGA